MGELTLAVVLAVLALASDDRPDVVIADFESQTYAPWITTGEAFGLGPAKGALTRPPLW